MCTRHRAPRPDSNHCSWAPWPHGSAGQRQGKGLIGRIFTDGEPPGVETTTSSTSSSARVRWTIKQRHGLTLATPAATPMSGGAACCRTRRLRSLRGTTNPARVFPRRGEFDAVEKGGRRGAERGRRRAEHELGGSGMAVHAEVLDWALP
jgi:hypothetical protein